MMIRCRCGVRANLEVMLRSWSKFAFVEFECE